MLADAFNRAALHGEKIPDDLRAAEAATEAANGRPHLHLGRPASARGGTAPSD